ncbi:MAG: lipopolysaccharide biosynthesis protein [Chitinophagaceae bacterium]|nr:lipopolysaccharide biosynthesis protein [Chitinophagaceae bacterium]MCA6459683.1 lipopolysaccharide biosynthesis protein [Chitinophagaceae bacterium]MCA6464550.1 lipopolysaccharide biosynthesis protein [Chitinophagaceae bacterium]
MKDEMIPVFSLKQAIQILKDWTIFFTSKWKIILIVCIAGALIGLLVVYPKKNKYTALLSFAMEDDKSSGGLGGALGLASQLGFDLGSGAGGAFSSANIMELFKSRTIIERALLQKLPSGKGESFAELYINFNNLREKWKASPELMNVKFTPGTDISNLSLYQNQVIGSIYGNLIKDNLTVNQKDKKISIITIEVVSENEDFSKYFSEALVNEVTRFYVDTKTKKSIQNLQILQKQTDSLRTELNLAITGSAVANDNVYNLNPAHNINRVPSAKKQIDVQANTAILVELLKNLEVAKITLRKETPLVQIIDKPFFPLSKKKSSKLKGLLLGAFLGVVSSLLFLGIWRLWRLAMQEK